MIRWIWIVIVIALIVIALTACSAEVASSDTDAFTNVGLCRTEPADMPANSCCQNTFFNDASPGCGMSVWMCSGTATTGCNYASAWTTWTRGDGTMMHFECCK